MITRFVLAVSLVLSGTALSGIVDDPGPTPAAPPPSGTSDVAPEPAGDAPAPEDLGEVTVTEVEVVVPPADPASGEVRQDEATRERLAEAEEAPDALAADEVSAGRVETEVLEAGTFQTVGVTWPGEAEVGELDIAVRTRADGVWSGWTPLTPADDAPDPGTPDAENAARGGTDPLWVGDAEAVQVSFAPTGEAGPEDLALTLVDTPPVPESMADGVAGPGTARTVNALYTGPVATSTAPRIISRSEWGARAQVCTPAVATKLVGAVLHHTAGSNSYSTVAEAMRQIRGDQAYHIDGRQWCDLGYNFVVDKWGNIYEGRANSLAKPIVGVHAGGFNTGTVGISMLGTYGSAPSAATTEAVAQIIGWRLGQYGVDPRSSMTYWTGVGQNSKYQNQNVHLPRVFGHRDVAYTSCPGNGGYSALPGIRDRAATLSSSQRFRQAEAVVRAMYQDLLDRTPDANGLADWSFTLANGGTAVDVTTAITRSEEYNRRKIAEAYRTVLGRSTDEPGVLSWLAAIGAGTVRIDEIANHLVASEEFYLRSGGDDAGLVQAMYTSLLGREGSAEEITYWTSRVPRVGRAGVITAVTGSREAAQRKVQQNYRHFLGRFPDIPGQSLWTDVFLAQGEAAVRANIVGSEEYRLRAVQRFG